MHLFENPATRYPPKSIIIHRRYIRAHTFNTGTGIIISRTVKNLVLRPLPWGLCHSSYERDEYRTGTYSYRIFRLPGTRYRYLVGTWYQVRPE